MHTKLTKSTKRGVARQRRTCLRAQGVEASIPDEHTHDVVWHMTPAFGGVRIWVPKNDEDYAERLLAAYQENAGTAGEVAADNDALATDTGVEPGQASSYARKRRLAARIAGALLFLVFVYLGLR